MVTIRRSKTDQAGEGRQVAICFGADPTHCPVRAVKAWLSTSGISSEPQFRSISKGGAIAASTLTRTWWRII